MLNVYLTDSPVSVLQKEFVEIEDALCTDVDFHITDHLKSTLMFTASSVPIEDIEEFPAEFFKTLRRIVEEKDIDMARMATVIEKETLKVNCMMHEYSFGTMILTFSLWEIAFR